MIQQVNFYKAEFKPKRVLFSFPQIALGWIVVTTGCALYSWYLLDAVGVTQDQMLASQAIDDSLNQQVSQLEEKVNARQRDPALQRKNDDLRSALQKGEELLHVVEDGEHGVSDTLSMASVMEGLARQSLRGVSLEEIHIEHGPELVIQGKAVSADQVPVYLQQLGDAAIFSGMRFDDLELNFEGGAQSMDFRVASKREQITGDAWPQN
jgi:hypothetical protein